MQEAFSLDDHLSGLVGVGNSAEDAAMELSSVAEQVRLSVCLQPILATELFL